MKQVETTGDDWTQCLDCYHIWNYMDDACPECGSKETTDMGPYEAEQKLTAKFENAEVLEELQHLKNLLDE